MIVNNKEKEVLILNSTVLDGLYIVTTSLKCKIDNNKIMRKLFISLMLTLTAFLTIFVQNSANMFYRCSCR